MDELYRRYERCIIELVVFIVSFLVTLYVQKRIIKRQKLRKLDRQIKKSFNEQGLQSREVREDGSIVINFLNTYYTSFERFWNSFEFREFLFNLQIDCQNIKLDLQFNISTKNHGKFKLCYYDVIGQKQTKCIVKKFFDNVSMLHEVDIVFIEFLSCKFQMVKN